MPYNYQRNRRTVTTWAIIGLIVHVFFPVSAAAEDAPRLVKDINQSTSDSVNLSAFDNTIVMTAVGSKLFFRAWTAANGNELWVTDGSEGGTTLVKDIREGVSSSSPQQMVALGQSLIFRASNGTNGEEIWISNGSAAGTTMLKDINDTGNGSSNPRRLISFGSAVFFSADDGENGEELWKTDGTPDGTVLVKDINPEGDSELSAMVEFNGSLYFTADDGEHGIELWKTDGTKDGTTMVKDIYPGSQSSEPSNLVNANGAIYFSAKDDTRGFELWKSDGTQAGTVMVKDANDMGDTYIYGLTSAGDKLFYVANTNAEGDELWVSNGTGEGTMIVKDIIVGSGSSYPSHITFFGGAVLFVADDGVSGAELWKSDGTQAGTMRLSDINPAGSSSPIGFRVVGDELYFFADNGTTGIELWKTDGTSAGTQLVFDIRTGSANSTSGPGKVSPEEVTLQAPRLVLTQEDLYFVANDGTSGFELWKLTYQAASPSGNIPASSRPYEGPIDVRIDGGDLCSNGDIYLAGQRLSTIEAVSVGPKSAVFELKTDGRMRISLAGIDPGRHEIRLWVPISSLNLTTLIDVANCRLPGGNQDPVKVNVGSFNGKLVVYASGLQGRQISWKVGGRWGRALADTSFARFDRPTPLRGVVLNVEIFVDGVSQLTKRVVTR